MFCAERFLKGGSGGTFLEGLFSVGRLSGKFCALRYYGPFYVEVLHGGVSGGKVLCGRFFEGKFCAESCCIK